MRILITGNVGESLPPPYAGIPKRALLIASMLRKRGHTVGIVFVYRHDTEDDLGAGGEYFFDYAKKPTKISKLFFVARHAIRHPFLFSRLLNFYIREHRRFIWEGVVGAAHGVVLEDVVRVFEPDIILSEAAIIRTFMATQIAVRHNIPIIFDTYAEVRDPTILALPGGEKYRAQYWRRLLSIPALIIAPSYYCGKGPQEFAPPGKVSVIYAGIEFEKYRSAPLTKEEARAKLRLPHDGFLIIAVGSLSPRKGHDHMLDAISRMPASLSAHAIICGPDDASWLRDIAREKGILDRTHFFTNLSEDDLIALYRASDVYCDASNTPRACLGMSVTEAMAVGMPVVAYNVGGLPEIVKEGENGFLVPLDDIQKLSEALRRVAELPRGSYGQLTEKSILLAKELVDIRMCAQQMISALEGVYQSAHV